jgi:hypothetical protein
MVYSGQLRDDAAIRRAELEEFRCRGDSAADAVVETFKASQGERGIDELENVLVKLFRWPAPVKGADKPMPQTFVEFLLAKETLPDWFEKEGGWARVARGQALYQKYRLTSLVILGCASLPHCYANSEIAGSLIMSGRLASQVKLRLGETGNFLDTSMKPDGLHDGAHGLLWIRKVRLIHAVMRVLIEADPAGLNGRPKSGAAGDALRRIHWRNRSSGRPIDQLEMAFVLLTFSLVVVEGWKSLGIEPGAEEIDDYTFGWALIGHMLGVEAPLLEKCRTLREARELSAEMRPLQQGRRSPKAVRAGRLLSAALLVLLRESVVREAPVPAWLRWTLPSLPQSLVRHLIGRRTAGELWVERAPLLPRVAHWLMIRLGAFGSASAETELGKGMGRRIEQEFCATGPQFRGSG